ncbi:hypothetical protein DFQ28_009511 [Apophysomyces sp. BC1034]|nr:hypothetical protein DFQ28_009511 [Apophysomyces sp. BC1034]
MNQILIGLVVELIIKTLIKHQQQEQVMKDAGVVIIGYVRKSKTLENNGDRTWLLQEMGSKLRKRLLSERVYTTEKKACLVSVDFADISTNDSDIYELISSYDSPALNVLARLARLA